MAEVDSEGGTELPDGAWTVGQLNEEIQQALKAQRGRFPTHIVGEIAEVDDYEFGSFFELRDLEKEPFISCLAWSHEVASFDHDIEAGTEAVVEATVDFYPERGDCQLLVSGYWPVGESNRQQELEQLETQLAAEGLFEQQQTAIKRLNDAIEEGYASGFIDEIDWDALDERAEAMAQN